jgi:short-subunit dehydrogenase
VVVTGASSGIGLLTARMIAAAGGRAVLVARNADALRDIVTEIEADGGKATYAIADVADVAAVSAAADHAVATFGRIDGWVNCAGVAIYARLTETPEDEHQRLFQTNYFGVVHGSLVAVEHLREHGGALVTVGSISGDIPSPVMGAYDASKHAVKGFVESLRMELRADARPISVTLIKPSGMNTPIGEHAANHLDGEALIPPPVYDPALVADAILDALQRPRETLTVGGIGRLEVLLGEHFPKALGRLGGLMIPLLFDPRRPKTLSSNLDHPVDAGRERSRGESGRSVSLYAIASRRPLITAAALVAGTGLALLAHRAARA